MPIAKAADRAVQPALERDELCAWSTECETNAWDGGGAGGGKELLADNLEGDEAGLFCTLPYSYLSMKFLWQLKNTYRSIGALRW